MLTSVIAESCSVNVEYSLTLSLLLLEPQILKIGHLGSPLYQGGMIDRIEVAFFFPIRLPV